MLRGKKLGEEILRYFEECLPLTGDALDLTVRWRNGADLAAVSAKPVWLQFSLRQSVLYTWQFR